MKPQPKHTIETDERDFNSLITRYYPNFLAYCKSLSKLYNLPDFTAEDILHTAIEKALKSQNQYIPNTQFKAWMNTIIQSIVIDLVRKKILEKRKTELNNLTGIENLTPRMESAEYTAYSNEVLAILRKIPEQMQQIISLHLTGNSQEEIAIELGINIGTVKSRLHRALKLVRELI